MYIGKTLKTLRKSKNLTLKDLSAKSGVQLATLSRIENLKMVGTLESHMQIATALGVDLSELYSDIEQQNAKTPDKQTEENRTDIFVHSPSSSYEILTKNILSKQMMPILLNIEAQGQTQSEQNTPNSERFIFILEGSIEVIINEQNFVLSKGNTLYFDASLPHYFINKDNAPAKLLSVTTPVNL